MPFNRWSERNRWSDSRSGWGRPSLLRRLSLRFSRSGRILRRGGNRRRGGARLTGAGRGAVVVTILALVGIGWSAQAAYRAWQAATPVVELPSVSAPPPAEPLTAEVLDPPRTRARFSEARLHAAEFDPAASPRLVEWMNPSGDRRAVPRDQPPSDGIRVEYSLDEALTGEVFEILRKGRVDRGHAIVLDPRNGRVLAYVSTDPETFPAKRAYPAASIVKVLTAAAMLEEEEGGASASCVYRGNKYRLNRRRLDRPSSGRTSGLEDALASSNNQCFSQWALHSLGEEKLTAIFKRFGWLSSPAPGHDAGRYEAVESRLDLGKLGSGLDGMRVTPLHVAALTTVLTGGELLEPWWVDRVVDARGRSIDLPERTEPRIVLPKERAETLREMLVATTTRGTAKSAFRTRRGRPKLGDIKVAGKTGNLTGRDPYGRYEWFMGLAPADDPQIGVVVLQLQSNLWWKKSSELAASILNEVFCDRSGCRPSRADRLTGDLGSDVAPLHVSELERPRQLSRLASEGASAASRAPRKSQ